MRLQGLAGTTSHGSCPTSRLLVVPTTEQYFRRSSFSSDLQVLAEDKGALPCRISAKRVVCIVNRVLPRSRIRRRVDSEKLFCCIGNTSNRICRHDDARHSRVFDYCAVAVTPFGFVWAVRDCILSRILAVIGAHLDWNLSVTGSSGAGNLTINGSLTSAGTANLGAARKVVISTQAIIARCHSPSRALSGNAVSENVMGTWVSGDLVESVKYYDTVTQIAVSAAFG